MSEYENEYEGDQVENIELLTDYTRSTTPDGLGPPGLVYRLAITTHHDIPPPVYGAVHAAAVTTGTFSAVKDAWIAADPGLHTDWLTGLTAWQEAAIVAQFKRPPAPPPPPV